MTHTKPLGSGSRVQWKKGFREAPAITVVLVKQELGTHKGRQTMSPENRTGMVLIPICCEGSTLGGQRTSQNLWVFHGSAFVASPSTSTGRNFSPCPAPDSLFHLCLCASAHDGPFAWCFLFLPNLHKGTSFHSFTLHSNSRCSGKPSFRGIIAAERKWALKLVRILLLPLPSCVWPWENGTGFLSLHFICKMSTLQSLMIKPILVTDSD